MNKGKGLIRALRPRRGSRAFNNYDEEQAWEDDMIFKAEGLKVKTTMWPDPDALQTLSIEEDFAYFLQKTKLEEFASHPQPTYYELSREFLATFRFVQTKGKVSSKGIETPSTFDVRFVMRGQRLIMPLEEFCKAIHVPNEGKWDAIPADADESLRAFWRSISVDVPEDIHRGKFTHIQHPALRYFALFLCRGFLARKNSTGCTGPIIYLLRCAKEGVDPEYNLGVIIARTLSYAVKHNETKPLHCGAIATLVYEYLKHEKNFEYMGNPVPGPVLLDTSMLLRMGILREYGTHMMYQYMVNRGRLESTLLPRVDYFDRITNKWTAPVNEYEWEEAAEPSSPATWGDYPQPPAYGTWGGMPAAPEYHPGEGSSSQQGNEGTPQQWPSWEQPPPYYGDGSYGWGHNPNYPDY